MYVYMQKMCEVFVTHFVQNLGTKISFLSYSYNTNIILSENV